MKGTQNDDRYDVALTCHDVDGARRLVTGFVSLTYRGRDSVDETRYDVTSRSSARFHHRACAAFVDVMEMSTINNRSTHQCLDDLNSIKLLHFTYCILK